MRDQNTCCCIYHVELDELKLGLNNMRGQGNFEKVCIHHEHEVCAPCKIFYKGTTSLWESIVCPKSEFDECYNKECLYGNFTSCGVEKLSFYSKELDGIDDQLVEWRRYALEETRSKIGKPFKKLTLVYKRTSSDEFIQYLKLKLQHFVRHNFAARWQDKHLKTCMKSFLQYCIISMEDFAKNYSFQVQNEVQSMHWHSYQISILVHITYRSNLDFDMHDEDTKILIEYHFYISNDRKHDYEFVQHCFGLHWRYISNQRLSPRWHYVWFDGCINQFKSSKPWYFVYVF